MRFYNQPHRFYAGGDLHARTLFLHILDDQTHLNFFILKRNLTSERIDVTRRAAA